MLLSYLLSLLGLEPTFQKSKCRKLLDLTNKRAKLLKSREEAQLRQLRKDVAELLQLGKEQKAQVWIGRIFKELRLMSVYSKISDYCQFVRANLPNIAKQRDCPSDLEGPLASLCFAASCCANFPELQELREIFAIKYCRHFVTFPQELLPDCRIDQDFLDFFSAKDPSDTLKRVLLEEIASQYDVKQSNQHDIQDKDLSMEEFEEKMLGCEQCAEVDVALESNDFTEDLGSRELAQELANRKRIYEGRSTRSLSFKRAYGTRQPSVHASPENEESGDESAHGKELQPAPSNDIDEGRGKVVYENVNGEKQIQVYVEKPVLVGAPRRAPPPPPPPRRAPPLPPPLLRTASMPSSQEKKANVNMGAPLHHCPSMEDNDCKGSYRTHVHPRLPMYEDLVANFVALRR